MSKYEAIEERLAELEIKFSYQQETIDALNETVTKQYAEIDRLKRDLQRSKEELSTLIDTHAPPADEKPPHY